MSSRRSTDRSAERRLRGSGTMGTGPTVNLAHAKRGGAGGAVAARPRTPSSVRRSRSRSRSPGGRRASGGGGTPLLTGHPGELADREALAEKLTQMGRRCRESEEEASLLRARLQRAEAEGSKKDRTIDELLEANAGGYTDGATIRRTQQQLNGALKARVAELEGMLLEKEAALQKVVHPAGADSAQRIDELERERRVCYVEVRRLRQLLAEGGGGQGGDGDRPRQAVAAAAAGGDAVGGGGGTAELRQLRQVSRA
jgi:hypothetical protein